MDVIFAELKTALFSLLTITIYFAVIVSIFIWFERRRRLYTPFSEDMCRLPGHTLRREAEHLNVDLVVWLLSGIFFLVWLCRILFSSGPLTGIAIFSLTVVFCSYKSLSIMKALNNVTKGLRGEEYTGQELNFLMKNGAYVFHDIHYKYGNIDHIAVCPSRILVVETKTLSKPQRSNSNKREYEVRFDEGELSVPGHGKIHAVNQAKSHASHLRTLIKKKCGVDFPITPVVALPGWFVTNEGDWDLLVLNPKRAQPLRMRLAHEKPHPDFEKVVVCVENLARSVFLQHRATDPDASKHFDLLFNPKRNTNF